MCDLELFSKIRSHIAKILYPQMKRKALGTLAHQHYYWYKLPRNNYIIMSHGIISPKLVKLVATALNRNYLTNIILHMSEIHWRW